MKTSHFVLFVLFWILFLLCTQGSHFWIDKNSTGSSTPVVIMGTGLLAEKIEPIAEKMGDETPIPVRVGISQPTLAIKQVNSGDADIGLLSRPLSPYERAHYPTLQQTMIGYAAFVLVVSPANTILSLSEEEVRGIFTGKIRDFKDVGGKGGELIQVLGRPPEDASRNIFRKIALKTEMYTDTMKVFPSDEEIIQTMAGPDNETMIAVLPLSKVPDTLRILSIRPAGNTRYIWPTFETVTHEKYPFIWPLYIVSRSDCRDDVRSFVMFLTNPYGKDMLVKSGIIPVEGYYS